MESGRLWRISPERTWSGAPARSPRKRPFWRPSSFGQRRRELDYRHRRVQRPDNPGTRVTRKAGSDDSINHRWRLNTSVSSARSLERDRIPRQSSKRSFPIPERSGVLVKQPRQQEHCLYRRLEFAVLRPQQQSIDSVLDRLEIEKGHIKGATMPKTTLQEYFLERSQLVLRLAVGPKATLDNEQRSEHLALDSCFGEPFKGLSGHLGQRNWAGIIIKMNGKKGSNHIPDKFIKI